MKQKKYDISFSQTEDNVQQIEKWLIAERNSTGEGFYCNWNVIKSMFKQNQVATISDNGLVVGFATWCLTSNFTARIEIAEIKPTHRGKSLGRMLAEQLLIFLKSKNILAVDLQCAPSTSEPFWKCLGFSELPDPPENYNLTCDDNKRLYKVLVDNLSTNSNTCSVETIELWNEEPYRSDDNTPTYLWNLSFKKNSRELVLPIIHPAHFEWRLRWRVNDRVVCDHKVKRFVTKIDFDNFIVIDKLKL